MDEQHILTRQETLSEIVAELVRPTNLDVLPLVVGISSLDLDDTNDVDLFIKPEENLEEALLCSEAPQDWEAMVILAEGLAREEDGSSMDVVTGYGLGRNGEEASVIMSVEGTKVSHMQSHGKFPDLVRRCLGLETMPCMEQPIDMMVRQWLAAILVMSERTGGIDSWQEAALCHAMCEKGDKTPSPKELAAAAQKMCARGSWEVIRRAVAEGSIKNEEISAEMAGWMDEGIFARYTLNQWMDMDEGLEAVKSVLDGGVFEDVADCVDAHF